MNTINTEKQTAEKYTILSLGAVYHLKDASFNSLYVKNAGSTPKPTKQFRERHKNFIVL